MFIPNVPLPDKHSGMMDWLGHPWLEHESLETALKKVLHSQGQHIIKFVLTLIQKSIPIHPPEKGFTLKNTSWVFFIKGEKHSCCITNAAQCILNPPKLSLTTEPILSNKLQLSIQTLLLIGTSWFLEGFPIYWQTQSSLTKWQKLLSPVSITINPNNSIETRMIVSLLENKSLSLSRASTSPIRVCMFPLLL